MLAMDALRDTLSDLFTRAKDNKRLYIGLLGAAVVLAPLGVAILKPPKPFKNRLEAIPETSTTIDNALYDKANWVASWWRSDNHGLASLHLINPVRVPYFDRIWKAKLPLEAISNGKFLDAGCGGGIATEALAKLGYSITGLDMSKESVQVAVEHAAANNVSNVTYKVGSLYEIPFPPATFDGIVSSDVLEHIHDLRTALMEIHRVLKPGGVFVFDTINRTWWSWILGILVAQETLGIVPPNAHDWRLFITPSELKNILEETGFEVEDYPSSWRGMSLFPKIFSVLKSIGSAETSDLSVNYLGNARKKQ